MLIDIGDLVASRNEDYSIDLGLVLDFDKQTDTYSVEWFDKSKSRGLIPKSVISLYRKLFLTYENERSQD
jgi:hypothetical protein